MKIFIDFHQRAYMRACGLSHLSCVWFCATLWTLALQALLSVGILQARILEWFAMPSCRGSSQPRDQTHVSYVFCIGRQVLYHYCYLGSPFYAIWWSYSDSKLLQKTIQRPNFLNGLLSSPGKPRLKFLEASVIIFRWCKLMDRSEAVGWGKRVLEGQSDFKGVAGWKCGEGMRQGKWVRLQRPCASWGNNE